MNASSSSSEEAENGKRDLPAVAPRTISADEMKAIESAIREVGDFGEVRLIIKKGRVRFLETIRSLVVPALGTADD